MEKYSTDVLGAQWAQGHTRALDALPGRDVGARAPRREQGGRQCPRRPHPLWGHCAGAGPSHGALPAPLLRSRPIGHCEHSSHTVPAIGSHGLASLCGPSMSVLVALGGRRVPGSLAPRRLQGHAVGRSDAGDAPVAPTHTWRPCARVPTAPPDCVPLVVPGGTGMKAQFDVVSVRACDRTGPVTRR
jgi:hypothetical protein